MLQLLKIEWLKLKNYKAFWIFLGLYVIGLFGINYIAYYFQQKLSEQTPLQVFPYDFPQVYLSVSWVSSWLLYFPGMLMILTISNEYTFKTHRQNIIDGFTRQQFIMSKILFGIVIGVITTVFCFLNAIIFGVAHSGSVSFDGIEYIGYSFIQTLCYIFFAMILAVLMRRSGLAMAILFLYGLIFEQMIGITIDNKILHSHSFWYYMPLEISDVLVPIPFGQSQIYSDAPSSAILISVCIAYILLYCFLSIRKFQTDDL